MKKVLLLTVCALMGFALNAQVSENFSDYTVGGKLAQQAQAMGRDYWTTWSNAPGTAEDAVIAEMSGNKVAHFTWGNDQILQLGNKTAGVWDFKCKVYVPTGKDAYFNIISHFTGDEYGDWAVQVCFACDVSANPPYTPGQGKLYAGAQDPIPFTFTHATWIDVLININLDDDEASLYLNDTQIHQWTYSLGTFGEGCPKVIELFDIFPSSSSSLSEFYLDDIVFEQSNNEILYSTSFDDKPNGSYVAESYPTWWTTWDNNPGTDEDALISNEQAASTPNSAKCAWGTDLVFKAGDQQSGAYTIDFDMYIPASGTAFFNLLHAFAGSGSEWAVGVYFNIPAGGSMPAGTNVHHNDALTPFTFPFATWFPVSMFVDLDADVANIKINGTQILEWQYSIKESGGAGLNQLAAADFYPPMAGSVYYIDNFVYTKMGEPLPWPTLSVYPDELTIELLQGNTKEAPFTIVSEEEGTRKANWSAYIEYSDFNGTDNGPFTLAVCDPYEAPTGGVGSSSDCKREIAIKITPADYVNQLGGELKQLGFFINQIEDQDEPDGPVNFRPGSDLTFRVYAQGGPGDNEQGVMLAEKVLTMANFEYGEWNFVDITPVKLTGGDYWIAVEMLQKNDGCVASYPLTYGSNTYKHNGDWIRTNDGIWGVCGLNHNWAIQAKGGGEVQRVWGLLEETYGSTFSASESEVNVIANATGMDDGTYTANIVILTNVPGYEDFEIPLTMIVGDFLDNDTSVKEVTVDGVVAEEQPPSMGYDYRVVLQTSTGIVDIVVTPNSAKATVEGEIGDQPVIKGTNNFTFTVIAEDGTEQEYKLRVMVGDIVAISEITNEMALYPNPVSDYLYIKSDVVIEKVTIYDLTGKMVKQVEQPGNSIDLSNFAPGFYLLKANTSQGEMMQKFIKE